LQNKQQQNDDDLLVQKESQTDCKPSTDDVARIQINNFLEADGKYVDRNIKVSIIIQRFCDVITKS